MKHQRKVLVIGNFKIPLGRRRTRKSARKTESFLDQLSDSLEQFRYKLKKGIEGVKPRVAIMSVVVIMTATIVPTAMVFGTGEQPVPAGNNIGNLIGVTNAYFYPGSPGDDSKIPIGEGTTYDDGVPIKDGDFALFFEWQFRDIMGAVEKGDWFDVTIDLGLSDIDAKVKEQQGSFAPIIYLGNGTPAGTIKWVNTADYQKNKCITLRLELSDSNFEGLIGDGTEENRVRGTGIWGFRYEAGNNAGGNTKITWQIAVGDSSTPGGSTPVIPQPPSNPPGGGNDTWNPYDKNEPGYDKTGRRVTVDETPAADTIFYWNIFINGHKHKTLEEWAACPNNTDANKYNDDPPLPAGETFTIYDRGVGIRPTWLRNITGDSGKAVIDPQAPIMIDKASGFYGNGTDDKQAAAYFKLFYVNSDYIWQDRIDKEGSGYETPGNDKDPLHQPSENHAVGAYDPNYSTSYLNEGEESALLYAPNYSGSGEKYHNYLTPVPQSDIKSITLTDDGFEIEMFTDAILGGPNAESGRTLAIGFMTKAATNAQGVYDQNVSNVVGIRGVNNDEPIAGDSGRVLLGGTVSGGSLTSQNKGKFIIEKLDRNTTLPMPGVTFDIICSSDDKNLEQAAIAVIESMKANSPGGVLKTGADGKIVVDLPPLPWQSNLNLTITETAPEGYIGVKQIQVTIEPENGAVISVERQPGDKKLVEAIADNYGILVWNKSSQMDTSYYDVALRKFVKMVEHDGENGLETIYFNSEPNVDAPGVNNGDRVLFRVDVYNQSYNFTQITQITDFLPKGLKFDPNATMQNPDDPGTPYNNSKWQLKAGTTDVLEYIGEPITFGAQGWGGTAGVYPEHRLALVLTVDIDENADDGGLLTNIAEVTEIQDQGGNKVEDVDSTPDADRDNDGAVPGIDYGENPPPGVVVNNDIEGHRINEDGETDRAADEDDSDFAQVRLPKLIECEVDKDTIRRTSAAFVGLSGEEGWNNVGKEQFCYNIDARSTSVLDADVFIIDDPLQNVAKDQIRLVALWTPVAWGDLDGKFNLWYQTNKTNSTMLFSDVKAMEVDYKTKELSDDLAWLPNTGYKLWAKDLSTTERKKLEISELDLAEDEYITALRFEYGAVKAGFTTKNNASVSLNGEQRNSEGLLTQELKDISVLGAVAPESVQSENTAQQTADTTEKQSFGDKILIALGIGGDKKDPAQGDAEDLTEDGMTKLSLSAFDALAVTPTAAQDIIDWTPKVGDPFYAGADIDAIKALELHPISYLVEAVRPMENEDIVSTVISRIAKYNAAENKWLTDADEDGVITKEIVTFKVLPDDGSNLALVTSTHVDDVPRLANTEKPAIPAGSAKRTSDEMKLGLWIGITIGAIVCLLLLLFRRGLFRNPLPVLAGKGITKDRLTAPFVALAGVMKNISRTRPKTRGGKHARRSRR